MAKPLIYEDLPHPYFAVPYFVSIYESFAKNLPELCSGRFLLFTFYSSLSLKTVFDNVISISKKVYLKTYCILI